ncbi:hypothetical protein RSOLAG22IIIB_13297 [Rhizoctonia solani]|uniref:Uncharacterized protein n=1 Tax=Rhizoctonia solani TaxID=456999 RepID=A0A0K6FM32_9AGAM|nr:hypothetical protein RSOLAG22IIIB_13297 [Rhizoctonia solani]
MHPRLRTYDDIVCTSSSTTLQYKSTQAHRNVTNMSTVGGPDRAQGHIVAGAPGSVISKYVFNTTYIDLDTPEIKIPLTLNINSDSLVPAFKSQGAPDADKLEFHHDRSLGLPNGLTRFEGSIGSGFCSIKIPQWNILIKGPIEGGPKAGLKFVGSGNWSSG